MTEDELDNETFIDSDDEEGYDASKVSEDLEDDGSENSSIGESGISFDEPANDD